MSTLTNCRGCGAPLAADQLFCGNCGVRRTDGLTNGQADQTAPQPQAQSPQQYVQPAQATEPVPVQPTQQFQPQPAQWVQTQQTPAAPALPPGAKVLKGKHMAVIAGVVALFLVGMGLAGAKTAQPSEAPGDLVGQLPFGPEGGTQTFDDGKGKMEVPAGALDKPETIVVRRTVIRERVQAASPTGTQLTFPPGALVAYIFGPITIRLNRPITITLRLPVANQSGIIFVTTGGRILFFPGSVGGTTIRLRLTSLDLRRPGAIVAA